MSGWLVTAKGRRTQLRRKSEPDVAPQFIRGPSDDLGIDARAANQWPRRWSLDRTINPSFFPLHALVINSATRTLR
jgi:hypothetical protein